MQSLSAADFEEAQQAAGVLEDRAVCCARRSALAQVARLRAGMANATGDRDAGLDHLRSGLSTLDGIELPFEEARLRLDYGQGLLAAGQQSAGLSQLEACRGLLVALRARPLPAACDRALDALACRQPPDPWGRLSARERQVVELVTAGLPNREIAHRLDLSTKTIEACLTRLYAKLGLRTRGELRDRVVQSRSFRTP